MQKGTSDGLIGKGRRFLDQIYEKFPRDPEGVSGAMADLLRGLCEIRREMPQDNWQRFCKEIVPAHELTKLIRQDPFTFHSVKKPRGYAGDASLLDYIYGQRSIHSTSLGKHICEFTTNTPPCRAVRKRARIIAGIIDRVAWKRDSLRILSVACGHLREAEMSKAVKQGKVREYVAFDQDTESLAHIDRQFIGSRVKTVHGSIIDLLMGRYKHLGGFDLVYAAGLYDYLSRKLATRLTTWMFKATRPGGMTLLTNFLPDTVGTGYMEAFMEWNLIYRSPEELVDTVQRIPSDEIADKSVYVEDNGRVAFVELCKVKQPKRVVETPFRPVVQPAADLSYVGRTAYVARSEE